MNRFTLAPSYSACLAEKLQCSDPFHLQPATLGGGGSNRGICVPLSSRASRKGNAPFRQPHRQVLYYSVGATSSQATFLYEEWQASAPASGLTIRGPQGWAHHLLPCAAEWEGSGPGAFQRPHILFVQHLARHCVRPLCTITPSDPWGLPHLASPHCSVCSLHCVPQPAPPGCCCLRGKQGAES